MKVITQNPYRQLGIFANASTKDRVAAIGKLKAFLKVGRQMESPFDKVLPPIERSEESVAEAEHQLTLPADRMRYAQFWFVKATPIDEVAFNHLFADNVDEAIGFWNKKDDASSLQNRTACYLIKGEYENALICAQRLYSDFIDQFISLVLGDGSNVTTDDLSHDFLDTVCEEVGAENMLRYLEAIPGTEWKEYVGKATIAPIIQKIHDAISTAKGRKGKEPDKCLAAGKKLMSTTKPLLTQLRKLLPKTDIQYQMIADKLGLEILQCGIDYYNDSDEPDCATKAMQLQEYALKVVVGKMAKDRCQENVDILKKIIAELPPAEVMDEHEAIQRLLVIFSRQPDLIKHSIQLIKDCATHVVSIKEKLGRNHKYYLEISTTIVNSALGNIISEVNEAQAGRSFSILKDTLILAWRAQLYLDKFDVEPAYKKGRYKECRDALQNIIKQCKGFEIFDDSSKYRYGCGWCNNLDVSDVDLRTAKEKLDDIAKRRKKNIKIAIWIGITILVLLITFLIGGISGLAMACTIIAVISGIVAIIGIMDGREAFGCALLFLTGASTVLSIVFHAEKNNQERHERQERLYERISLSPTEESCSEYISDYETYEHADDVRKIWFDLIIKEARAFNYYASVDANSASNLSQTENPLQKLEKLPYGLRSEYEDKAKSYIENICDSLYKVAARKSTVDCWKKYQRIVPSSYRRYGEAAEKIKEIENRAWNTEPKAWRKATTENSLWAYEKYKSLYPKGAHINQCEKKIIDLEVSRIYAGEHGTLPAMDRTEYGNGSTSYITVKNSTSYILTILYSGPDSKRLVIEPNGSKSIRLKNGQYRTAASVSAYNVSNYAGKEDLRGGSYSVDYYISTSYRTRYR